MVPLPAQVVNLAVRGPEEKTHGFFHIKGLTLDLSCMVFEGTKVADLNKTEPPISPVLLSAVERGGKHWKVLAKSTYLSGLRQDTDLCLKTI